MIRPIEEDFFFFWEKSEHRDLGFSGKVLLNMFQLHGPSFSFLEKQFHPFARTQRINSGVLSACCNAMIIALMPLIRSYLGDPQKCFTFQGFNENILFNCPVLLHQDFMEMVYGFIFQSLPVDTWVINVYVLEFLLNKSHIFH